MGRLLSRIKGIIQLMRDPAASKFTKLLFILAVVYFLSPLEVLPDIVFPLGFLDDLILWGCLIHIFGDKLDSYADRPTKTSKNSKKYKGAMEAEYEVCDEEDAKEQNSEQKNESKGEEQ